MLCIHPNTFLRQSKERIFFIFFDAPIQTLLFIVSYLQLEICLCVAAVFLGVTVLKPSCCFIWFPATALPMIKTHASCNFPPITTCSMFFHWRKSSTSDQKLGPKNNLLICKCGRASKKLLWIHIHLATSLAFFSNAWSLSLTLYHKLQRMMLTGWFHRISAYIVLWFPFFNMIILVTSVSFWLCATWRITNCGTFISASSLIPCFGKPKTLNNWFKKGWLQPIALRQ